MLGRQLLQLLFPNPYSSVDFKTRLTISQYKQTTYLLPYREPAVARAIKYNKYEGATMAAKDLARALDRFLKKYDQEKLTIVPLPQSYRRWRERGFHHLEAILTESNYKDAVRTTILKKGVHTERQAHVPKDTRLAQQAGSFIGDGTQAGALEGVMILFDDVVTTGATMEAARVTLQRQLSPDTKLICVAIAH